MFAGLCVLAAWLQPIAAVDRTKFRTCEQGSFCRRFKKWIQRPGREEALWSVLPDTRGKSADGAQTFKVKHKGEADPHLLLTLNLYASGMVRMRLSEIDPLHTRYVIPAGDCISDPAPAPAEVEVSEEAGATVFNFMGAGVPVQAKLFHIPVGLTVSVEGRVVQTLNARNFLNFERYRKPKESRPPDSLANEPGADQVTIDAAAHPHGLDANGLWEEDFGGHTDKKPRGPASYGMDVTFEGDIPALFGLPEHATKASLPFYDEPYRFFNLDVFEYEIDVPMALYGTIPIIYANDRISGKVSGFLWIAPSETFVKLERPENSPASAGPANAWVTSESGSMDVVIFTGPTPAHVSAQFHDLTGLAPLPPLWSLGKHQCRWNYMSEKDVATVDAKYDKYDIPYDVIWLDIEHTDGKQYFTWNSANFPTPEKMINAISEKKRKFVNVVDPHIKKEEKFHVYTEVRDKGLFIKKVDWRTMDDPADQKPADWTEAEQIPDPTAEKPEVWNEEEDGKWEPPKITNPAYKGAWRPRQIQDPASPVTDFEGWCWPGTSLYPDFSHPDMRKYWASQFALDKYKGTTKDLYIWNDMNEPSVFNGPEVTMPRDAIHPYGNVEHRDVHNMYGYYVHRATFEGLADRSPGDRPFVLSRSSWIGSHKYAAVWTGDNYAKWEHLQASMAMVTALGLGGQSLVGADVGGFFKHPDSELAVRWYQLAVLAYGFLRNHAHLETPRREPYMFDEPTMLKIKAAIQLRYKMLPLWYTVFHEWASAGLPVVRPVWFNFMSDPETLTDVDAVENEVMLGDAVLVRGITAPLSEQSAATVYLPQGKGWYEMYTGSFVAPGKHPVQLTLNEIPTYFRAGTIVPLKSRMRRSASCMVMDPLSLQVYLDPTSQSAVGQVYMDDYKTKQHEDGSSFLKVQLGFKDGELTALSTEGTLPAGVSAEIEKVEIFGLTKPLESAELTSKGTKQALTKPTSKALAAGGYVATLKVLPWVDLRHGSEWALKVA